MKKKKKVNPLKIAQGYWCWNHMVQRCLNPKNRSFSSYGGRGITVYKEWIKSYKTFLSYVGPRPSAKHSIDRYPDNDGNYEPGNVRWATRAEQRRNRSDIHELTFRGETRTLTDWARLLGMKEGTLDSRINCLGWSPERALTEPIHLNGGQRRDASMRFAFRLPIQAHCKRGEK